jgi:hypothetical protein
MMGTKTALKKFAQRLGFICLLTGLVVTASARPAYAFCEVGTSAAAGVAAAAYAGEIAAATTVLTGVYTATITAEQAVLIGLLEAMETLILNRMKQFWSDWEKAWKDMTAQLHAGVVDQTRQMSNMFDSSNVTQTARTIQRGESQARRQYKPTEQSCRFDTVAGYRATAERTERIVQNVMAKEISDVANSSAGTAAAGGPATFQRSRWQNYQTRFCDNQANAGNAGCTAALPDAGANVMPSRTLFAKETLDTTNPNTAIAISELTYNLTGIEPVQPIPAGALSSSQGKEERQESRSYLAQMDAVSALIGGIVAERTPGQAAPEVADIRTRMGISDASPNPSSREIRQATIEQLWDPNYYVNLTDSPSAVSREEVFLQAYNLMLLYRLIEKTERIANAYAVQTANVLDRKDHGRGGADQSAPVQ